MKPLRLRESKRCQCPCGGGKAVGSGHQVIEGEEEIEEGRKEERGEVE
jgi:hypothetical protein